MAEQELKQSKLIPIMETFGNLFALNILFLLFCIPVITIGASFTAMYSYTLKMVRKEEGTLFKSFWEAFKANFKRATAVWMIVLVAGVVIGGEIMFFLSQESAISYAYMIIAAIEIMVVALALRFLFPLVARYDNTLGNTIKNSILLSVGNLGSWIKICLIWFMPVFLSGWYIEIFISTWYLWLIILPALLAYCSSFIMRKVFDKVARTKENIETEKSEKETKLQEQKEARANKIKDKMKRFENPETDNGEGDEDEA